MATRVFHIYRDHGGMGDMIRTMPVVDGLRQKHPEAKIRYHGEARHASLMLEGHCWGLSLGDSLYMPMLESEQRRDPLRLRQDKLLEHETAIDLYCPGAREEWQTRGRPQHERTELFCKAAGLAYTFPKMRLNGLEMGAVETLRRFRRKRVILHPKPKGWIRAWAEKEWQRLGLLLTKEGYSITWVDSTEDHTRDFVGRKIINAAMWHLVSQVAAADLVIAVDSGIFHMAGALQRPTLGLFGPMSGHLIVRPYPTAQAIQGGPLPDCEPPCYGYREQGFGNRTDCVSGTGCASLALVTAEQVFEKARAMLQ